MPPPRPPTPRRSSLPTPAAVALGSNLGDRAATLDRAVRRLRAEPGVRVVAASGYYETPPVGGPAGQGPYLNAALTLLTDTPPAELLGLLHHIERQAGRVRTVPDAPRPLDLDLLLYGDLTIHSDDLTVPHPRLHQRAFVLVPLAAVAADWVHPGTGSMVADLLAALSDADRAAVVLYHAPPAPPGELAGQVALVTGSTSGIGRAIADAFRRAGARVLTHGRRPRPDADYVAADLADSDQVDRLAAETFTLAGGASDIVVLNAGADTLTGDAAGWGFDRKLQELLAVDLVSTVRLGRTFGAAMKQRGRGVILTVGWDQAETGMGGDSGELFAAVKGGVMAFTRSLAVSLAPEVRVNCLAPGWVRTAWGETASAEWQERVRRETPLGVWGLPDDVAAAAVWLAGPAAAYQTGQVVRVNGGAVR